MLNWMSEKILDKVGRTAWKKSQPGAQIFFFDEAMLPLHGTQSLMWVGKTD